MLHDGNMHGVYTVMIYSVSDAQYFVHAVDAMIIA